MNPGPARGDHLRVLAPLPSTSCGTHVSCPCICVWLHVADQLSLHSGGSFLINSPVRGAGLELAPGLVACNPIVCFFVSSWSGVSGSFPDRQATRWATQAAAGHGTGESPQSAILDRGTLLQRAWCGSPASWWRSEFSALLEARVWGGFNLLLPRPCLQRLALVRYEPDIPEGFDAHVIETHLD